jgi:hypothetical protein
LRSKNLDEYVRKMIEKGAEQWKKDDGIWTFGERIYVPTDIKLCREIISKYHDTPPTGHYG